MIIRQMIRDARVEMALNIRSEKYTAALEIPVAILLLTALAEISEPVKIKQYTAVRNGITKAI